MQKIDLTGKRFGMWLVLDGNAGKEALCRCDCGTTKNVSKATLRNGSSTCCGCRKVKHGMDGAKVYRLWCHMRERCQSPKHKHYHSYGGRGITVCDEWQDAKEFMEWAISNGYREGLTIDRKNVNLGYSPDNCQFITIGEQQANKRNSRLVEISGETKHVAEWARIAGLSRQTVRHRLSTGVTGEALLLPVKKKGVTSGR